VIRSSCGPSLVEAAFFWDRPRVVRCPDLCRGVRSTQGFVGRTQAALEVPLARISRSARPRLTCLASARHSRSARSVNGGLCVCE
jgi:hypothetical protein